MELIGLLMREHRLIEQIITPLNTELKHISHQNNAHPRFIYDAMFFFRTFADKYHHGKEEDILFFELSKKELDPEHLRIMNELKEEHSYARRAVSALIDATMKWSQGDQQALCLISDNLRKLIELYPRHIKKEDKEFFFPCQGYFVREEREELLKAGYDFNKEFATLYYENRMNNLLKHI
jgi:hemerythrin-like domain-containing protein